MNNLAVRAARGRALQLMIHGLIAVSVIAATSVAAADAAVDSPAAPGAAAADAAIAPPIDALVDARVNARVDAPVEAPVEEIVVTARRRIEAAPPEPAPLSVRNAEDIARLQPNNLFALTADMPGISINGGPRSSGMKFNIRGFSDTEDVIVELDGISRGFEKYRFGSGIFIEPELLTRLEVERTPSILRGSGAVGGSVSARTRSADQLLVPGERLGVLAKTGFASNNDERQASLSVFGAPLESIGVLASYTGRDSNDIRLPDGTRLADSETNSASYVLQGSWQAPAGTALRVGYTNWADSGRQPYDATGGQPGFFGTVARDIDDQTAFVEVRNSGLTPWIDAGITLGTVNTRMEDLLAPGETPFSNAVTGNVVDTYAYRTTVARLDNVSRIPDVAADLSIAAGVHFIDSSRDISRVTENEAINDAVYPNGFNAAQPPGAKRSLGVYLQPALTVGRVTGRAGARWDRYVTQAEGGTAERMEALGEETRIDVSRLTPALGAELELLPQRLRAFYNYAEAFRPPLIDEYFTQGAFGRCIPAFLGELAPESGVCGDLYVPEESRTREVGLLGTHDDLLGGTAALRLAWFRTDVRHTLESISVVAPGEIGQPGREDRSGFEAEASYESSRGFGRVALGGARGQRIEPDDSGPLYDLPGDRLSITLGLRFFGDKLELGYRFEDTHARNAVVGTTLGQPVIGTQEGYRLHGAFATVRPLDWLELRLLGENLTNTSYQLNDGFGGAPGTEAPGRDLRLSLLARF